jgi:steroid 5-alpha reductase family enzyme
MTLFSTYGFYGLFIVGMMTVVFWIAHFKKDNSIVDIFWGTGFCAISSFAILQQEQHLPREILVWALVMAWGTRLSTYLFRRNNGKPEDFRYANWRKEWGKHVVWRSFLQIFMLQGFFMFIISLPVINVFSFGNQPLNIIDGLGVIIWLIGFLSETIADRQMYVFKQNPAHQGKIMTQGIWKVSRHPNYFGEILQWWGIFLLSVQIPYVWISIISPVTITWLLMKVSGVPMLEKKYKNNVDYQQYIARTPALFPTIKSLKTWIQG